MDSDTLRCGGFEAVLTLFYFASVLVLVILNDSSLTITQKHSREMLSHDLIQELASVKSVIPYNNFFGAK